MKGMCFFALKLIFNFFLVVLSDNMSETNKQTPNIEEYPDYPSADLVVSEERRSMTRTERLETSQERELRLWKAESHDKICKEIKKLRGKYIDPLLRAQRAGILWDETDQVAPLTAGALASILQDDEEEERRVAAEQEKYSGYGGEGALIPRRQARRSTGTSTAPLERAVRETSEELRCKEEKLEQLKQSLLHLDADLCKRQEDLDERESKMNTYTKACMNADEIPDWLRRYNDDLVEWHTRLDQREKKLNERVMQLENAARTSS